MTDSADSGRTLMLLRNFFGQREGQTLRNFAGELAQLSIEEREELAEAIRELENEPAR